MTDSALGWVVLAVAATFIVATGLIVPALIVWACLGVAFFVRGLYRGWRRG